MKKTFTKNDLADIARQIIKKAQALKSKSASVVALSGELGAGKTTLTQEIARALEITENIISPTFVIMKSYKIKNKKYHFKNLVHIDAYRLESDQELLKLGWEELVMNPDNLILIEWPEKVPECIPKKGICKVFLSHKDEETREIEIVI